MVTCLAEMT